MAIITFTQTDINQMIASVDKLTWKHCKLEGSMHDVAKAYREIFKQDGMTSKIQSQLETQIKISRVQYLVVTNEQKEVSPATALQMLRADTKLNNTVTKYKNRVLALIPINPVSAAGRKKGSTNLAPTTKTSKNVVPVPATAKPATPKVTERASFFQHVNVEAERLYAFHLKNKDLTGCDDLHKAIVNFHALIKTLIDPSKYKTASTLTK